MSDPKAMRDELTMLGREKKDLTREIRGYVLEDAGFGPESKWGRAVDRSYDGPNNVDAVRRFAFDELGIGEAPPTDHGDDAA